MSAKRVVEQATAIAVAISRPDAPRREGAAPAERSTTRSHRLAGTVTHQVAIATALSTLSRPA